MAKLILKKKKITKASQFSIGVWNIHQAVLDDNLRTINSIEGWHRSLNTNFIVAHPSLVSFLTYLKNEEFVVRTKIKEIFLNPTIDEGNENRKTIKTICKCYKKYYNTEFLKSLASVGKWKLQ